MTFLGTLAGVAVGLLTSAPAAPLPGCAIADLPGLGWKYARLQRELARPHALAAPAVDDFWRVANAVLAQPAPVSSPDTSVDGATTRVGCDDAVRARDHEAWLLSTAGYSAQEIADIVGGHLRRQDLDDALRQLMLGRPKPKVAEFLETRWREPVPGAEGPLPSVTQRFDPRRERSLPGAALRQRPTVKYEDIAGAIGGLAAEAGVEPALIDAMVRAESSGNAKAVSSAGAIGLMQLMPPTAAALGVDPWDPVDNLRGGIAYIAELLRAYNGDITLALIAYNAGPQHADRVRAGLAVPYRQTRQYVESVLAYLNAPNQ